MLFLEMLEKYSNFMKVKLVPSNFVFHFIMLRTI